MFKHINNNPRPEGRCPKREKSDRNLGQNPGFHSLRLKLMIATVGVSSGCTGQVPGAFLLQQQKESFTTHQDINTKIDLLWVVDNSASMDVAQNKIRDGFAGFATKYMKPTWDIRTAVITTDTFLANSAYTNFLATNIAGYGAGTSSAYVNSRLGSWVNPASNPTLVNTTTGVFTNGVKWRDFVPSWGPNYARLLPGYHDGPITAFCFEGHPYFYSGSSQCRTRDQVGANTGTSHCLAPSGAETSITQCVNTLQNDTVRSGKAIISTKPPTGTPGDAAWTQQLISDFTVNVTPGSEGSGSERGMQSFLQLLADNESTATAFFRANSLRGIIFVSDEEDQTQTIPASPPANYGPFTGYAGGCSAKTVDGYTYTIASCPNSANLVPVSSIKTQIDNFFTNLDLAAGTPQDSQSYFVTAIVPLTGASIQAMQAQRAVEDAAVGSGAGTATDRGDRYLSLVTLAGNGSLSMDLGDSNYAPILAAIGAAIVQKKGTFTLTRAPTSQEDMIVEIRHADGTVTVIAPSKYTVNGASLSITDEDTVLSFQSDDQIYVDYQPKTSI